jgi:hypothetical protein
MGDTQRILSPQRLPFRHRPIEQDLKGFVRTEGSP